MARLGILEEMTGILCTIGPAWFRRLIVNLIPLSAVQDLKRVVDTMHKAATKFFQSRKELVEKDGADNTGREDLLNLLGSCSQFCFTITHSNSLLCVVRVNSHSVAGDRLSDEEAIAQLR